MLLALVLSIFTDIWRVSDLVSILVLNKTIMIRNAISRTRKANKFIYSNKNGQISDKNELKRIADLAIPPAWNEVKIAGSPNSKIQAVGRDDAGRHQYIYSQSYQLKQAQDKFDRITNFAEGLPKLRQQVEKDLNRRKLDKQKIIACAVTLMDETYFRVGNKKYAREHESYGLTTLRSKHLEIHGDTVVFDFNGKSGQQQHKELTDHKIAKIIKKLDEIPGYELFRYYDEDGNIQNLDSSDINDYIKNIMGDDYSAKDFRTWGGTLLACIELAKIVRPKMKHDRNKTVTTCVKKVAKKLGNTPATARGSYIDPRILEIFNKSDSLSEVYSTISKMENSKYLSQNEMCVLRVLKA
jgi:DNA topoisomerase-1